jgi:hypothetical protein
MKRCCGWLILAVVLWATPVLAQTEAPSAVFRRANENASRSRWDDAIADYGRLARAGVRAPSVYWNWAQAASASGRKGEALWALLCARALSPTDSSINRELERLRAELGLDPSEVSLGLLGDARIIALRFRFDWLAGTAVLLSIGSLFRKQKHPPLSLASLLIGVLLITPVLAASGAERRGVVVQKDAPLVDTPSQDAVALANLREGEVVPLLGEEGDYLKIQDASGARGFAHQNDVRKLGVR